MQHQRRNERVACVWATAPMTEAEVQSLAEACLRLSPQVAVRGREAVFIEIGACRLLYSETSIKQRLLALAHRLVRRGVRVAIERDAGLALARARVPFELERMPLSSLADFVDPFGAEAARDPESARSQARQLGRQVALLAELGVRSVGEFLQLPPASLASRLGREALSLSARVRGELGYAWPGFHPPEKISERSDAGGENLEALLFVIRGLLDRVTARLRGRALRASSIEVTLEMERWSTLTPDRGGGRRFVISFSLPQGALAGMLPVIRERLGFELQKEPLEAPVECVEIEVLETVPGRGAQKDFFSRKEEQDELIESLLGRIGHKFGHQLGQAAAFIARPIARHLPEKSYERTLEVAPSREAPVVFPRRPSRLLPEPERISFQGLRVAAFEGPERISPEWWEQVDSERDYYRVVLSDGAMLWVYREPGTREYFVHGIFD